MNYTIITDEKIKEKLEKVFKLHNERVTILQQKSKTNVKTLAMWWHLSTEAKLKN